MPDRKPDAPGGKPAAFPPPSRRLLVSCEDFSGHIPGRFGVPDYRAALSITAAIRARLHHHLPRHRLTFLSTTRQPLPWLRAIHWQFSNDDELTQGLNRFARTFAAAAAAAAADFGPLLESLRAQMPDTPVLDADLALLARRRSGPVEAL